MRAARALTGLFGGSESVQWMQQREQQSNKKKTKKTCCSATDGETARRRTKRREQQRAQRTSSPTQIQTQQTTGSEAGVVGEGEKERGGEQTGEGHEWAEGSSQHCLRLAR